MDTTKEGLAQAQAHINRLCIQDKIKDLLIESIALQRLDNLDEAPLKSYIDIACKNKKFAQIIRNDMDGVFCDARDIVESLKREVDFKEIAKNYFYDKACSVFQPYFYNKGNYVKYFENSHLDEDGLVNYLPYQLKSFIKASLTTFLKICDMPEVQDFADIISTDINEGISHLTYVNRLNILTLVLMDKVKTGRNITRLLFDRAIIYKVPDSFKQLCEIANNQYIISNTDSSSLDFQLAVFDMISFADNSNKQIFNNKVKQYYALGDS